MELNTPKSNKFLTVPEAAHFLNISITAVRVAIKTKKLNAKREGYYWKIPLQTLEAYNDLRKKVLSTKERTRGIDSKAIQLGVLKNVITQADVRNVRITKNFEIFRGNTLKPLIDESVATAVHLLTSTVYENFEPRFFNDDLELSFENFIQRLFKLKDFFEQVKVDPKKLSVVKAMIKTLHSLSTKWVKLEACTGRMFIDQGLVFFGARILEQAQEIIRNFCCQADFKTEEILDTLDALYQP